MFKEQYCKLNKQVNPNQNLVNATICKAEEYEAKFDKKPHSFKRPLIALASICVCLSIAVPVLAATVEPVYQFMYKVSPTAAQFFTPVRKSAEDNGIKMEVVSANIQGSAAKIYVTMQDLTGDRIDETTDLYDSYTINRPFDSSAHCERVGFDEHTKTATFMITIEKWGGQDITGDKVTFSVQEFLSRQTSKENVEIQLKLTDYLREAEYQLQSPNGGSSVNNSFKLPAESKFLVSKPSIYAIMDNMNISNVGLIDGKLHVQMQVTEKSALDPHGFFYLIDKDGNKIDIDCSLSYAADSNGTAVTYDEFIFDVAKEDLQHCKLYGSFYTSGLNTKGNWKVTFPLEKANYGYMYKY